MMDVGVDFDVDVCVHGNDDSNGRCTNQHQNIVLQGARLFYKKQQDSLSRKRQIIVS
jgi:hypothetical protein